MRLPYAIVALLPLSAGHNSLVIPTPRNAVDGSDPRMKGGATVPGGITCTCADSQDCQMGAAREIGGAGQPCLWWSQGCSIGCDYCLTDPRHPANNGSIPRTTRHVIPWTSYGQGVTNPKEERYA